MSRHPEVKWAQRKDKVFITVQLPDAKDAKVNLQPDGVFTFSASAGSENHLYELELVLFDKVKVEESKINYGVRSIFCILEKAESDWWKKLLRGDGKPPHYVKVDWDKWVDEDDDNGGALDLGGMDFDNFGGGFGEGMPDDGEFDESDDEEEVSKPGFEDTEQADGAKPVDAIKSEGENREEKEATTST